MATKVLAGGLSIFDIRNGQSSGTILLNYMNKNTDKVVTKNSSIELNKNGKFNSRITGNKGIRYASKTTNLPQLRWIPDSANILKEKVPLTETIGVQTDTIMYPSTPKNPFLPNGTPKIPVSAQGVPISTQTEMWEPEDPDAMNVDNPAIQPAGVFSDQQSTINNNYQITPVTNNYVTQNQYVQHVDQTQTQNIVNQTMSQVLVQQESKHLIDNRFQLLLNQQQNTTNFGIYNVPDVPSRSPPETFNNMIVQDAGVLMSNEQKMIGYPSDNLEPERNPNSVFEPSGLQESNALIPSKKIIPNRIRPKPNRKQSLKKISDAPYKSGKENRMVVRPKSSKRRSYADVVRNKNKQTRNDADITKNWGEQTVIHNGQKIVITPRGSKNKK